MKVVSSAESVIPINGLASGSDYQVHVESISLTGVANSKSVSFETLPGSANQHTVLIIVISVAFIALLAGIVLMCYR